MEQQQELFGKLFNTIPLYNEDHLDVLLSTMDKEQSIYILTKAVSFAFHSGVFSLGESEIISKSIRTLNKIEKYALCGYMELKDTGLTLLNKDI
jgi:hypothetical protein